MFANLFNSQQKEKEKQFKKDLETCENVQDFFNVCGRFYDLKNAKLGTISKAALIGNIDKIIIATNAKLK